MSIYNSLDRFFKEPFGAISNGTSCTFRIVSPHTCDIHNVTLLLCKWLDWNNPVAFVMSLDKLTDDGRQVFSTVIEFNEIGVFGYCFSYDLQGTTYYIKRSADSMEGHTTHGDGYHWELTCYNNTFKTPYALQGSIFYQIFPDRFYRAISEKSQLAGTVLRDDWGGMPVYLPAQMPDGTLRVENNDFFGGDLQGIIEKLPYLKSLGVKVLYLMPIVETKESHGYTTSDYMHVNPYLGSNEDLRNLCTQAHAIGMYVMLDGVFNHTGSNSVYFNKDGAYPSLGAYQSRQSPYYDWYVFIHHPDEYLSWWGFPTLPTTNKESQSFRDFIFGDGGVIESWFSLGIDGIRLDVVDELPDSFLTPLCKKIRSLGGFIIGEVWENAVTKVAYGVLRKYLLGDQIDGVMNYTFHGAIVSYLKYGNATSFAYRVMEIVESYPKPALDSQMNFASTHDTVRFLTACLGNDLSHESDWVRKRKLAAQFDKLNPEAYEKAKKMLKLAWLFLSFAPGNPCIYYGDEVGVHGYFDPFNRKCFPWDSMDEDLLSFFQEIDRIRNSLSYWLSNSHFSFVSVNSSLCIVSQALRFSELLVGFNRGECEEMFAISNTHEILWADNCMFYGNVIVVGPLGGFILKSYMMA